MEESSEVRSLEPDPDLPPDENLVCKLCHKQYKHGEIQKFRLHYTNEHAQNADLHVVSGKPGVS